MIIRLTYSANNVRAFAESQFSENFTALTMRFSIVKNHLVLFKKWTFSANKQFFCKKHVFYKKTPYFCACKIDTFGNMSFRWNLR